MCGKIMQHPSKKPINLCERPCLDSLCRLYVDCNRSCTVDIMVVMNLQSPCPQLRSQTNMAGLPVVFLWKQDLLVNEHGQPAWVSCTSDYLFFQSPLLISSKPSSFYILIVLTCPYHSYHSNIFLRLARPADCHYLS